MTTIKSVQNDQSPILQIAAARRLYSLAKKYNNAMFMLSIVLIPMLTFLSIAFNSELLSAYLGLAQKDISSWIAVASITVLTTNRLILSHGLDSAREKAAKIQEDLDRKLFVLPWNAALAGTKPRQEDIIRHGDWYIGKNGDAKLRDWYSLNSDKVSHYCQVLICQNSSLYWDVSLRQKINDLILWCGLAIFAAALAAAVYLNLPMAAVVTNIAALLGPISDYGFTTLKENRGSIKQTEALLDCIQTTIDQVNSGASEREIKSFVEKIQDQIFVKRKTDWLIPDKFYSWWRNQEETVMRQSSAQLEQMFEQVPPSP